MVRRDAVDPGGWDGVDPALLVVPVDAHMLRVGRALGLTARRTAGMNTALDITSALRAVRPDDPVRFDFALTHMSLDVGERLEDYLRSALGSD
jgi:uncharacterized protein (TIGR02757 family)